VGVESDEKPTDGCVYNLSVCGPCLRMSAGTASSLSLFDILGNQAREIVRSINVHLAAAEG
jgi:hypothetical protein